MIFSIGTPSASAAIWQNMVSAPVPMSVAPTSRLNEPSSFILIDAAPMSTPGDARGLHHDGHADAAAHAPAVAAPELAVALARPLQPMACAPAWMAWGRPQERMSCLKPSLPSPSTSAMGWSSPSCTWLRAAELERVLAQRVRDLVHVALEREEALRAAVAAEGAGHGEVRVDGARLVAQVRAAVERERAVAGHAHDGERVRAVGAGVLEHLHLDGGEAAVLHPALDGDDLRVARARRGQLLLARVLEPHRAAGAQGEHPAQVLDEDLLLAAEAAADARLDHADAADGDAEQGRDDAAHVERHLGGGAHHQAVVLVEPGDGDVRLDRGLLHVGDAVGLLEDALRLREAALPRRPPRPRSRRPGCAWRP